MNKKEIRTILVKDNSRMEEVRQSAIDQDRERWCLHATLDPIDPIVIKAKALQGMVKETLVHPIITLMAMRH